MSQVRVTRFVFVVPTTKLAESVRFYCEGIGLELLEEWSDMGRGALFRASDDAQVELIEMDEVHHAREPRVALGLQVEETDAVFARLTRLGVTAKAPPRVRPWGMYGFGVLDPNGVPINVYEPAGGRDADPG